MLMPLLQAFALGAATQLSLVLSGLLVYFVNIPKNVVGCLAGFGAGALIAAIACDLLPDAEKLHAMQVALWIIIGALVFLLSDRIVEKKFGAGGTGGALGIVVGAVIDGIPEAIIFGIQLGNGLAISLAFLAAVFVSNIPQALAPSAELAASGWSKTRVTLLWLWVVLGCGVAATLGYLLTTSVDGVTGARLSAFAAGGILAMLCDSLIPFAHERSEYAGLWTVIGFCAALAMT